ncbi:MAG: response regulator [Polyangiaceae bacterium]
MLGEDIALEVVLAAESVRVDVDQAQIDQVVMNLVLNARDAMPDGGTIRTTESARCRGEPSRACASPTRVRECLELFCERVFEPFFTTKAGRGAGLGLATVYAIVEEAHGSACGWRARPGSAPRSRSAPASLRAAEPTSGRAPKPGGGTETILVAEDEAQVRKLVVRGLRGYGYTVIEAGSGEDAIVAFEAEGGRVDLLLTDVVMPGMWAVARSPRSFGPPAGDSRHFHERPHRRRRGSAGISQATDPFVQKPFNVSTLARRIREVLDSGRPAPGPA